MESVPGSALAEHCESPRERGDMAGIADVARLAGVSKSTASRALTGAGYTSDETRERVRSAAASLGYVASNSAVSLATGRTNTIGVIMPYVNRWFFTEVLEGIQQGLLECGLDLTLYDAKPGTAGRARIFEDFLARKRFDGLIAVGLEPDDDEIERLVSLGRPVVSVVGYERRDHGGRDRRRLCRTPGDRAPDHARPSAYRLHGRHARRALGAGRPAPTRGLSVCDGGCRNARAGIARPLAR